jgi:hypothetical protein
MDDLRLIIGAAYLDALSGDLDGASQGVERVRSKCSIESSASMAAEVMLVEGVIHVYSGRTLAGVERLRRAVAIGDSATLRNLAALARGWLAVVYYNDGDVISAGGILSEALCFAEYADARTCLRVSTVAGGLCEYSGLGKSAANWLTVAQGAARRMAVHGVLSSVVYDLALAAIDSAAARKLVGTLSASEARSLPLRVRSALNYDSTANVGVHRDLHWLILAMAYNICADYSEAESCLELYAKGASSFRAADRICACIELAIAKSKGGELDFDPELIEDIENGLGLLVEPTERAMAYDILSINYQRQGLDCESEFMRNRYFLEINRRTEIASSLERLICEGPLVTPPLAWIN